MSPEYPVTVDQFRELVRANVRVTQASVATAKSMILSDLSRFSRSVDFVNWIGESKKKALPARVYIHPSIDSKPQAIAIGEHLTYTMSAVEAIHQLIHGNLLIQTSAEFYSQGCSFEFFLGVPNSGGYASTFHMDDFAFAMPDRIRPSCQATSFKSSDLVFPDLFIRNLQIHSMHQDVKMAIQESILCFRNDLFTASVAMLGKASEGAWLELGKSLVEFTPASLKGSIKNHENVLIDPWQSTMKKIDAVTTIFKHEQICRPLWSQTEVKPKDLEPVRQWSDNVRDSRNTIHFGVTPSIPNTHDIVSNYLLGAPRALRTLYAIKDAADRSVSTASCP